jgi:hypothetical protein
VKVGRAARVAPSRALYAPTDPIGTLDSAQKVALLEKIEQMARARDPRIVQVMAGVAAEYDVVMVARADGTRAADVRPLVRLSITVIAESNGRREVGSGGGGGRFGLGYFQDEQLRSYVDQAVNAALTKTIPPLIWSPSSTATEKNLDADALSGGQVLASFYAFASTTGNRNAATGANLLSNVPICSNIAGVADTLTVAVRPLSGAATTYYASLSWQEFTA